jgi:hypothetical protein
LLLLFLLFLSLSFLLSIFLSNFFSFCHFFLFNVLPISLFFSSPFLSPPSSASSSFSYASSDAYFAYIGLLPRFSCVVFITRVRFVAGEQLHCKFFLAFYKKVSKFPSSQVFVVCVVLTNTTYVRYSV